MNAHRYTYDLNQVSQMLNRTASKDEQITSGQLQEWAEQSCFPVQRKSGKLRVDGEVIPLIEKVRHYIVIQCFDMEQTKLKLKEDIRIKAQSVAEKVSRQQFQLVDSYVEMSILKQIQDESEEKGRSDMMEQLTNEQGDQAVAENRLKRAVIHSEMRMKAVVEKTEKHILEQLQQFIHQVEEQAFEAEKAELQNMIDELEETINVYQTDFADLQGKHQAEITALEETHSEILEKAKQDAANHYEELMTAGFFARLQLKKEWKKNQANFKA